MTAIAYRDGIMAADSLVSTSTTHRGSMRKIARSAAGTIGAAAGRAGIAHLFCQWIENGVIDDWAAGGFAEALPLKQERGEFGAIVVFADGAVICIDWQGHAVKMDAPFYVEGSAEEILWGALAHGASAEEAVRIAVRYETGCGGAVQVEALE